MKRILTAVLLCCLCLPAMAAGDVSTLYAGGMEAPTPLRAGPSDEAALICLCISRQEVELLSRPENGYVHVRLGNTGQYSFECMPFCVTGYVPQEQLARYAAEHPPVRYVNTLINTVHMRTGEPLRTPSGAVIAHAPNGRRVNLLALFEDGRCLVQVSARPNGAVSEAMVYGLMDGTALFPLEDSLRFYPFDQRVPLVRGTYVFHGMAPQDLCGVLREAGWQEGSAICGGICAVGGDKAIALWEKEPGQFCLAYLRKEDGLWRCAQERTLYLRSGMAADVAFEDDGEAFSLTLSDGDGTMRLTFRYQPDGDGCFDWQLTRVMRCGPDGLWEELPGSMELHPER